MLLQMRSFNFNTKRICSSPGIWGVVVCFLMIAGFLLLQRDSESTGANQVRFDLDYLPKNPKFCEDLPLDASILSPAYNQLKPEFDQAVQTATTAIAKGDWIEGHTGGSLVSTLFLHSLARQKAVRTICETGFNFGHSTFNYLTANDNAIVHSFDLGEHGYSHKMAEFLKKKFPNRLFVHFGDSTKTLPEFIRANPGFQCDLISVDGGHTYDIALADIKNFSKIANLEEHIILFDNHPSTWSSQPFGAAWDNSVKEGILSEISRCSTKDGGKRGWSLGRVLRRSEFLSP